MGPARWQDGGYDHRYSWLEYSIPEPWPGAMAPVAQGDADQTLRRPFLPSALQRRPGAQPRERLLDQRPEQGDEAERHNRTDEPVGEEDAEASLRGQQRDRKSTRLNSSHLGISYAVFCLKKKKNNRTAKQEKQK